MKEIGQKLKDKREENGVSVEEVAEDLKMRPSQIEAIESGDKSRFDDSFVLKDFILEYSKYLGLDSEKILDEFNEYMFETIFSRADIMKKFNMASSSAGKMLNKLKDSGTIEPVSGYGKGKYRFSKKNPAADEIKNQW